MWLVVALALPALPGSLEYLHHNFYALRHGQSLANVEGIISSDPAVACTEHGLSAIGTEQAQRAAQAVCDEALRTGVEGVAIISSDFRRAWQTAQAVRAGVLASGIATWPEADILSAPALRERSFGEVRGYRCTSYVWWGAL